MNNFISSMYLDSIKKWASDLLLSLAGTLGKKGDEFLESCRKNDSKNADRILSETLIELMDMGSGNNNVRFALKKLAGKFPELDIDLSGLTQPKDMVIKMGEYTDEMLKEAKERVKQ